MGDSLTTSSTGLKASGHRGWRTWLGLSHWTFFILVLIDLALAEKLFSPPYYSGPIRRFFPDFNALEEWLPNVGEGGSLFVIWAVLAALYVAQLWFLPSIPWSSVRPVRGIGRALIGVFLGFIAFIVFFVLSFVI
nr:hypothetical protein [uncultured bacterium]